MKLPIEWLNDFLDTDILPPPREFCEAMSLSGSKAEGWERFGDRLSKIVVGRVLTVEKHPNADRLNVCALDVGTDSPLTIVTAAPNVREGAMIPVALDGAVLADGKEIRAGEMRGVLSRGMMCSFAELGLSQGDVPYADPDGLLLLQEPCSPGDDICDVLKLNGVVVDFEITNNRPDCLSVRGLAREVAATFDLPLKLPVPAVKGGGGAADLRVTVENPELCGRYSARVVKNVKIEPSPLWLRARLRDAGVRPINNIVDITNYVLLEYGQPMHAFDSNCLGGGEIRVRTAKTGETITTLDGKVRNLQTTDLVIADAHKPVCVAGVMGGQNSEITENTVNVVLESATFNGTCVRKTALSLAMRTDASSRFEKGLDENNTIPALDRACELIETLGAGVIADGTVDVYPNPIPAKKIAFEPEKINALLGANISVLEMQNYLGRLQITAENGSLSIPSFRPDINITADIAEEVARFYGYNKITSTLSVANGAGGLSAAQIFRRRAGALCREFGFDEIYAYSFISPAEHRRLGLCEKAVVIENPLGEDRSVMRLSAIPTMLTALALNRANRCDEALLYEIGRVFRDLGQKLPEERPVLALGAYGGDTAFYEIKALIGRFGGITVKPGCGREFLHAGRSAVVFADGKEVGFLGEIHPSVAEEYGFKNLRVTVAELDLDALFKRRAPEKKYAPLPKYPAIRRDVSLPYTKSPNAYAETVARVRELGGEYLESVDFADLWQDKTLTLSLTFRSRERTLKDEDVDSVIKAILK